MSECSSSRLGSCQPIKRMLWLQREGGVADVYDNDYIWYAACFLLGILDLRVRRLVVWRSLLED